MGRPLDDTDLTQPPVSALRYETAAELYSEIPQVAQLTMHRPREGEACLDYMMRLRASTTPEEGVTFTAFAAQPKMAIWWGYECVRLARDEIDAEERRMMELVATWTTWPNDQNRFEAMRMALYARARSPSVYLGLAAGWSGGPIAPNDPAQVPAHRAPRAINTAVLSCLARADLRDRPVRLARFIKEATSLFRGF